LVDGWGSGRRTRYETTSHRPGSNPAQAERIAPDGRTPTGHSPDDHTRSATFFRRSLGFPRVRDACRVAACCFQVSAKSSRFFNSEFATPRHQCVTARRLMCAAHRSIHQSSRNVTNHNTYTAAHTTMNPFTSTSSRGATPSRVRSRFGYATARAKSRRPGLQQNTTGTPTTL